jgi:hypothetical protein
MSSNLNSAETPLSFTSLTSSTSLTSHPLSPLSTQVSQTPPSNSFALIFFPKTPGDTPSPYDGRLNLSFNSTRNLFPINRLRTFSVINGWGVHTHPSPIFCKNINPKDLFPKACEEYHSKGVILHTNAASEHMPVSVNSLSRVSRSSFFSVSSVRSVLRNTLSFKQPAPEHHAPLRFTLRESPATLRLCVIFPLSFLFTEHGSPKFEG